MPERLSPRLEALASLVPHGVTLADIGTDHAYLPLALLQRGWIPFAIAADLRKGPLENATKSAAAAGLSNKLSLRLGAGLAPVAPEEASCVVLAGMGGETIAEILESGMTLPETRLFLLQPMTKFSFLRRFLAEHGFGFADWRLAREGRRIYECWAVSQSAAAETDALYLHIGHKTDETASLYPLYVQNRLQKLKKRYAGLAFSDQYDDKKRYLAEMIQRMEKEVLV